MSFAQLDEAPPRDEAPHEPALAERPRRPARPSGPERRTLLRRRMIALGGAIALLALLVLATRGCLGWRADRAYTEYAHHAGAVSEDSLQEGRSLFELLGGRQQKDTVELQNSVNGFRAQADLLVDRARHLNPPGRFAAANQFLTYVLEFRRDALARLAHELPAALGDRDRAGANARIADSMRSFLVSDVLYAQRVAPVVSSALRERNLAAAGELPRGQFLPGLDWLSVGTVDRRLGALRTGGDASGGSHGLSLGAVTAGGTTLSESSPAQIKATRDLAFSVQVQNQGSVPDEEVKVLVAVTGGRAPAIVERIVPSIPAGGSETATIPLADTPPTGHPVTVKVRVQPAAGEKRIDDNESSFPATFVGG